MASGFPEQLGSEKQGDKQITASSESMLVVVRYNIGASLRFLSHAETIKLFQRACVRAGIRVRYSQGFNPRPRLSLPFPRSVGLQADDDLFCLQAEGAVSSFDSEDFKAGLSRQLPHGCRLLSACAAEDTTSFHPTSATYVFELRRPTVSRRKAKEADGEELTATLRAGVERLTASEALNVQRRTDEKGGIRNVDVRPFLKSVEFDGFRITVECNVSSAGTIRVDEILKLLHLDNRMLATPIRRTSVQWLQETKY